ncbi:hypothetical protein AMTR_s00009p00087090 [Amborella trichopoda]|uniref:Uncharacterized protein n=1 Tax=Amborella trichopoda TaxID=13333 RepID=W1NI37_AMBTC|nr:hypothetical protein AMTR_s00009p00087090 [Amborella trichopoda]
MEGEIYVITHEIHEPYSSITPLEQESGGNEDKIDQDKQDNLMESSVRNPETSEVNSSISPLPKEGERNEEDDGKDMESKRSELEFAHALYDTVVVLHDESDRLMNDLNALHAHKDMLQSKFQLLNDHIFHLLTELVSKDALLENTTEERDMYMRRTEWLYFELDRLKAEMQSFTGHG